MANHNTTQMRLAVKSEVLPLSPNMVKPRQVAASAKAELDALYVKVEPGTKEYRVSLAELREDRQDEVEVL